MSTLAVNTIQAETGTTVTVASGHSLDASAGLTVPTGHIIQVVQSTTESTIDFHSSQYANLMNVDITPTSSSSKFLVMFSGIIDSIGDSYFHARFSKTVGGTKSTIYDAWAHGALNFGSSNQHGGGYAMNYIDTPGTTDTITYHIDGHDIGGNTNCRLNASGSSTLTVMEISG